MSFANAIWERNEDNLKEIFHGLDVKHPKEDLGLSNTPETLPALVSFRELVVYCEFHCWLDGLNQIPALKEHDVVVWLPPYPQINEDAFVGKGPPYATIVADPPWKYGNTKAKGAAEKHYPTMSVDEIASMPIFGMAKGHAHLYLWTTNYFLSSGDAGKVCRAWGFEPKTVITWEKTGRLGVGNYFRNSTEHMVFAVRGTLPTLGVKNVRTCFASPWIGHSRKPQWAYELVEDKSPGPYLELFARAEPNGQKKLAQWTRWGNQAIGGDAVDALDKFFVKFTGAPTS